MKILKTMQKIPAGILNVPMVACAIVNTFFPQALNIGGATTALFSTGTMTIIGIMLFVCGAQFRIEDVGATLKRGFILLITKFVIGIVVALLVMHYLGLDGFAGIPAIALIAAIATTNAGVYLAIVNQHGDAADRSAFGLMNLVSVPAVPILLLGLANGEGFDWMTVIATIAPFLLGMLVGNLDPDLRKFLAPGGTIILPFLGFCFGSVIDLRTVVSAGLSGLLLTALVLVINIPILLAVDKFILRQRGHSACGVVPTAGAAVAVPALYAASHAEYAQYASTAAAQIAMAVIITAIVMPYIANFLQKKSDKQEEPEETAKPAVQS